MDVVKPFALCIAAIVLGIVALKVFFTLWRILEKKFHPEKFAKPENTPEVAFRDLRKKLVDVHMKNGEVLRSHKYLKTLVFGDGEFATCTLASVYFTNRPWFH